MIHRIKSNRLNEFMDIMEEVEGKAVIWAHYRNDIESIYNALEKKFPGQTVTYFGDTSTDDRQKAIEEIQNPESKNFSYKLMLKASLRERFPRRGRARSKSDEATNAEGARGMGAGGGE